MKIIILLTAITCAVGLDLQAVETQSGARSVQQASKTVNTISLPQKLDHYYQQQQQQLQVQQPQIQHAQLQAQQPAQQYYPLQYISTPVYQQPQPQPAMIIIAQPPQLSQQTMISHAAQQLLNYFNSNPQARYQFLQGNYQPQAQQTYVPQQPPAYAYQIMTLQPQYQQVQSAHAQASPPIVASPQISSQGIPLAAQQAQISQHAVQSGAQESYGQLPHFQLPIIGQFGHTTHIPHIATLSQLTTQKYIPQIPLRASAPAIVTGLENFTPEQQAQIKAQLQTGGPITTLRSSLPPNLASSLQQSSLPVKTPSPSPTQNTSPQEFPDEDKNSAEQSQAQAQTNSFSSGLNYGNQFTKG